LGDQTRIPKRGRAVNPLSGLCTAEGTSGSGRAGTACPHCTRCNAPGKSEYYEALRSLSSGLRGLLRFRHWRGPPGLAAAGSHPGGSRGRAGGMDPAVGGLLRRALPSRLRGGDAAGVGPQGHVAHPRAVVRAAAGGCGLRVGHVAKTTGFGTTVNARCAELGRVPRACDESC
jgi:hypothetical protein